jgi:hypothetical protein
MTLHFIVPRLAMLTALSQRAGQRWSELGPAGQFALIAVVVGLCVVVATTWIGVRQWWQRWKEERTD